MSPQRCIHVYMTLLYCASIWFLATHHGEDVPLGQRTSWWRHQMEIFSALLAICAGNSPVPGEFYTQRPVKRSFDVFFDLRLNKRLSKQSWGWWLETLSRPLWRHRNEYSSTTATINLAWPIRFLKKEWCQMRSDQWLSANCSYSIANALELLQSCIKPTEYCQRWEGGGRGYCHIGHPSNILLKRKTRANLFVYHMLFGFPINFQFCTQHGCVTVVLCAATLQTVGQLNGTIWTNAIMQNCR